MAELEKVIKGLECQYEPRMTCYGCDYFIDRDKLCNKNKIFREAVDLLKAKELPDVKPEKLEERTTKWLDQMTAEERLKEIAAILDDWDGYRTAKGLGGLINEIWAYALYPVKTQEPDKSKYDYHTDHTDCPWYISGEESRCPVTCSQYRDGWNDAMNYIFRNGDGYRPYDRTRKGR